MGDQPLEMTSSGMNVATGSLHPILDTSRRQNDSLKDRFLNKIEPEQLKAVKESFCGPGGNISYCRHNFGALEFDWKQKMIQVKVMDVDGRVQLEFTRRMEPLDPKILDDYAGVALTNKQRAARIKLLKKSATILVQWIRWRKENKTNTGILATGKQLVKDKVNQVKTLVSSLR